MGACPASSTGISNQWRCPQTGKYSAGQGTPWGRGTKARVPHPSFCPELWKGGNGPGKAESPLPAPSPALLAASHRPPPTPVHLSRRDAGRRRAIKGLWGGRDGSAVSPEPRWAEVQGRQQHHGSVRVGLRQGEWWEGARDSAARAGFSVDRARGLLSPFRLGGPGGNGGGPLGGSQPGWRCWWPSLAFPPGPEHWHENYPMAKGDKQSPIEINSKDVRHDTSLSPWHASYDPGAAKTILNNGRTCRVVFDDTFDRSGQLLFCLWGVIRNEGLQSAWNQSIPQQLAHTNEEFV